MQAPPVVQKYVTDRQEGDQHPCGPLGLETNNHHDTSNKGDQSHHQTNHGQFSGKDETHEQEDEQNSSKELNVSCAVGLGQCWQTSENGATFRRVHCVSEQHEETTADGQSTEDEGGVEEETVTERLRKDNGEETTNRVLGVLLHDG
jgi:hypothetical protein